MKLSWLPRIGLPSVVLERASSVLQNDWTGRRSVAYSSKRTLRMPSHQPRENQRSVKSVRTSTCTNHGGCSNPVQELLFACTLGCQTRGLAARCIPSFWVIARRTGRKAQLCWTMTEAWSHLKLVLGKVISFRQKFVDRETRGWTGRRPASPAHALQPGK